MSQKQNLKNNVNMKVHYKMWLLRETKGGLINFIENLQTKNSQIKLSVLFQDKQEKEHGLKVLLWFAK